GAGRLAGRHRSRHRRPGPGDIPDRPGRRRPRGRIPHADLLARSIAGGHLMLSLVHVTFDCADAAALAGFWSRALRLPIDDGANEYFATIGAAAGGVTYMFCKVGEPKTAKNRCHLDFAPD